MDKMWAGRFTGELDSKANDFNSSIRFDSRMYFQDIEGSMAHAAMLGAKRIITQEESDAIISGLAGILDDLDAGRLQFDPEAEDIHMFVEKVLTERIGEPGKKLHTARSRNDQVALDTRLYLRDECTELLQLIFSLMDTICVQAEKYAATIMPGYTHMQRAQPVTFGHHLLAYAMMFKRDAERIEDAVKRMNYSPIGCCALAGTTYDTDRDMEAYSLGFAGICMNSLDGVSDRDFCVELCSALATLMMHLSRFSEEIIMWASWEFKFIELDDAYSTGSSIMPQKKNPDMAELCRGKTGRVYGDLITLLTVLKGLPLAYNKDMQEDKEAIFDACDTVKQCLEIFTPMLATLTVRADNMRAAAAGGFINATDLADYLTRKGLPFRSAYKITGQIVARCIAEGQTLETLPLETYKEFSELFADDLYDAINIENCVARRTSAGGPSAGWIARQIDYIRTFLTTKKREMEAKYSV
ncbi:MAG: argininosuccinate lyase [Oscillospiraceae bacterium]|nr:argininosuccinate lyase [Oscillospiraceae bacterium]